MPNLMYGFFFVSGSKIKSSTRKRQSASCAVKSMHKGMYSINFCFNICWSPLPPHRTGTLKFNLYFICWCYEFFISLLIPGNTTNLNTHLKQAHKSDYKANLAKSSKIENAQRPITAMLDTQKETHPLHVSVKKMQDERIDDFIINGLMPLNIVEKEYFCNLFNILDPRYQVPCTKTVTFKHKIWSSGGPNVISEYSELWYNNYPLH